MEETIIELLTTRNPLTESEYAGIANQVKFKSDIEFDPRYAPRHEMARIVAAKLNNAKNHGQMGTGMHWNIGYLETATPTGVRWMLLFWPDRGAVLVNTGMGPLIMALPE